MPEWGAAWGAARDGARMLAGTLALGTRSLSNAPPPPQPPASPRPRSLLRKYPTFPDMRAALCAALWEAGLQAEAEAEWQRVDDPRYRDRAWLARERRWPPRLVAGLEAFLDIRGVAGAAAARAG